MGPQRLPTLPQPWTDPVLSEAEAYTLLTQPHHELWALGTGGEGGYALIRVVPQTQADILTLYVPASHRRKGHAKALMEAIISAARAAHCTGLTLEVNATNAAAIALYTVCGLQQVGKRVGYYPDSVSNSKADALVMAVSLT